MKELVQNKDIYRRATFWSRYFYTATTISKQILFQQRYFFKKSYFFTRRYNNYIIIVLLVWYFIFMFFRTVTFWKKLIFQKTNILHWLLVLVSSFFVVGKTQLFMAGTFSEGLLFKTCIFKRGTTRFPFCSALPIYQLIIKWARYQFHVVKVWEFFLVFLLLLKVALLTKVIYLVG